MKDNLDPNSEAYTSLLRTAHEREYVASPQRFDHSAMTKKLDAIQYYKSQVSSNISVCCETVDVSMLGCRCSAQDARFPKHV